MSRIIANWFGISPFWGSILPEAADLLLSTLFDAEGVTQNGVLAGTSGAVSSGEIEEYAPIIIPVSSAENEIRQEDLFAALEPQVPGIQMESGNDPLPEPEPELDWEKERVGGETLADVHFGLFIIEK